MRRTVFSSTLGQRVFKSEPQVAQTAPSQAELGTDFITWLKSNFGWLFAQAQTNATLGQSYVYDDANLGSTPNLLGEYGNGGTKSAGRIEYIWLPTEDGTSIPIGIYKGGRFLAVHSDHLGTPRLITDDTSKPVWQWPYSAFGDNKPTGVLKATPNPKAAITNVPQLLKATAPTEINLRFPGQYFDEESNLAYNGWRSYQPAHGRYTQSDPIGLRGGLNPFAYVDANPLSWSDPEGLQAEHTKNARPSTEQKHQDAEARRARDAGGEKGDQRRRPPSAKPPGHKGPWPIIPRIPGVIPLMCPLCEVLAPQPIPGPEPC